MEKSLSKLTIYGDYLSQPLRSVLLFCKLNKIKYDFVAINLAKGQHYTPEYKKINPFSKVPVIKINHEGNEKIIRESCTILRFLSDYYKVDNKWYNRDNIFRRANIDEWLDWHHSNTRYICSNAVFRKLFLPMLQQSGVNREVPDTEKDIPRLLTQLDKFLANKKYLVDDEMTIADLMLSCELNQLQLINIDISKYKNVDNYIKRMNSLPEMIEVNTYLDKLKKKLNEAKPNF
jgi:glutathione S-transferase